MQLLIGERVYKLRTEAKISREELAEICGVSVQSVQKWESGASVPDLLHAAQLAKYFNVSLDEMLFGRDLRKADAGHGAIERDYGKIPLWESYCDCADVEFRQCREEGLDVEGFADIFAAVQKLPQGEAKKKMGDAIFLLVRNAGTCGGYAYNEPSSLEEIKFLREGEFSYRKDADAALLEEKIKGAWTGRMCGCLLGKSVEGIRTDELIPFLKATGNYPLFRYIKRADMSEKIYSAYKFRFKDRIYADETDGMPADDDTDYTVLAQLVVERYGRGFTPHDVASVWTAFRPKNAFCTAERVAFCNFIKGYFPPESAVYQNPFREWIGAQIRGDYFGYINPGDPQAAAEAAFRDATVSHVKNGIYGEMFAAAMIAAAATERDIGAIVRLGLAQIPSTSRLYGAIIGVLDDYERGVSAKEAFKKIHSVYNEHDEHDWCHTVSNAVIVVSALLYGGGDFGKSVCLAVETGFDTDCNGATVGSVLGMRNGYGAIGAEWKKPIGDKLHTDVAGMSCLSVSDCVKKTLKHIAER